MRTRLELHEKLCEILGSKNVYFQPPESVKMAYPAIRYSRDDIDDIYADDLSYIQSPTYQIIVIDPNPDSEIPMKIKQLPMCTYDRHYAADNLNHDVFTIYL